MSDTELNHDRLYLRAAAVSFVLGVLGYFISGRLHPGGVDPSDHPAVFQQYAESTMWLEGHLIQFGGFVFIFIGAIPSRTC